MNVDKLRRAIDRGDAGDKVAANDPAAAPLGTDEEAGGHPPSAEQIRLASRQELARPDDFAGPERATGYPTSWLWVLATALLTGAAAALAFTLR
jgi:hypothetical protein